MWPGQQPPGGEQNPQDRNPQDPNPQDQNPYRQPGYQQPNPYQQPGYPQQPGHHQQPAHPQAGHHYPGPYQQPTAPQYGVPGPPQPGGPSPDRKKTVAVAIVAATAVVAAAVITGVLVLRDDGEDPNAADRDKPAGSSSQPAEASSPAANPRDGSGAAEPAIPGWKVVTNPKHGTQFDVPEGWEVAGTGVATGFEDEKKGDGSPVVMMTAPAYFKSKWCSVDSDLDGRVEDSGLGATGTKGGQGARNTAEAAYNEAGNWVWAAYAQTEPKGTVKVTEAKPYTTASGLSGHVSTATAIGVKKDGKCDSDGKAIAFSFKNAKGDFASWVLYAAKGVDGEIPDTTIRRILGTVRLAEVPSS
ncbi:hypothetical protein OTC26_010520 [Streptomyces tirandamycinicus]|uniref:hypothetical protein n=1 Tax=Streptomyces tirandamycinicus TaxID=2174846 RepID=UPI00226E326E|nr:hypothetical protein [Streptomyces tirandamycinicus]MCY0979602.1 hypothetical protein [Streptomyces tirandamycinicus]